MNDLDQAVALLALHQARTALRTLPDDAPVSTRCNAVNTALRALTAYREGLPAVSGDENRAPGAAEASPQADGGSA